MAITFNESSAWPEALAAGVKRQRLLTAAQVPGASRFDADFAADPPQFRIVDWTREPVLDSQHDARKRIYIATPKLFGTKAIKGEPICTWLATGRNSRGERPVREIKAHSSADAAPQDV